MSAPRVLSVAVLQHVPFEGPAAIADWFRLQGHRVSTYPLWRAPELPAPDALDLLVVMGGPMGVHDGHRYSWMSRELALIERTVQADVPTLGICLGAQLLAAALGAPVYTGRHKEIGWWPVEFDHDRPPVPRDATAVRAAMRGGGPAGRTGTGDRFGELIRDLPARSIVLHWHGDTFDLPSGATRIAHSALYPNQAFVHGGRAIGLQFHLEATVASVASLGRASESDIGRGPFQVDKPAALHLLQEGARRYGGSARSLLSRILGYLVGQVGASTTKTHTSE